MKLCTPTLTLALLLAGGAWAAEGGGEMPLLSDNPMIDPVIAPELPLGGVSIGGQYRLWLANPEGDAKSDAPALAGSTVDSSDHMDLDDNELFHDLSAWVDVPMIGSFRAGYWMGTFEGSKTLGSSVNFSGTTFAAGTSLDSEVEISVATLVYERELVPTELTGMDFTVSGQVGLKFATFEADLSGGGAGQSEDIDGIIPVLGLRVESGWWENFVMGEIEAQGMALKISDVTVRIFEIRIEAVVNPVEGLFAGLGYRMVFVTGKDEGGSNEDVEIDMDMDGFYFTVGYKF